MGSPGARMPTPGAFGQQPNNMMQQQTAAPMTQQQSDMARHQANVAKAAQARMMAGQQAPQQGGGTFAGGRQMPGPLISQQNGQYSVNNWAGAQPDVYTTFTNPMTGQTEQSLDAAKLLAFTRANNITVDPATVQARSDAMFGPSGGIPRNLGMGGGPGMYGMSTRRR